MRPYNVAPLPRYSSCRRGRDLLQWPAEHTYGVLAHLVERFHGMEEVGGSNPPYSTIIARFTALGYKPKAVLTVHDSPRTATSNHPTRTATSSLNHRHSPKTAATALPGSGVLR